MAPHIIYGGGKRSVKLSDRNLKFQSCDVITVLKFVKTLSPVAKVVDIPHFPTEHQSIYLRFPTEEVGHLIWAQDLLIETHLSESQI